MQDFHECQPITRVSSRSGATALLHLASEKCFHGIHELPSAVQKQLRPIARVSCCEAVIAHIPLVKTRTYGFVQLSGQMSRSNKVLPEGCDHSADATAKSAGTTDCTDFTDL